MIARGDLGVEIGDAEVPAIQKRIIERARALDKPVTWPSSPKGIRVDTMA